MRFPARSMHFAADDCGVETVEYAILAGLIVGATVATIAALGAWVIAQLGALPA